MATAAAHATRRDGAIDGWVAQAAVCPAIAPIGPDLTRCSRTGSCSSTLGAAVAPAGGAT